MKRFCLLLLAFALPADLLPAVAAPAPKPNILFLLADDLGYMDIGAFNPKTFYETPNIDSLRCRRRCVPKLSEGARLCARRTSRSA